MSGPGAGRSSSYVPLEAGGSGVSLNSGPSHEKIYGANLEDREKKEKGLHGLKTSANN